MENIWKYKASSKRTVLRDLLNWRQFTDEYWSWGTPLHVTDYHIKVCPDSGKSAWIPYTDIGDFMAKAMGFDLEKVSYILEYSMEGIIITVYPKEGVE